MRVIYTAKATNAKILRENKGHDFIALQFDRWDDFNYQTRFPTYCVVRGDELEIGAIKILFPNKKCSYAYLDELIASDWDGHFPLSEIDYVSVPEDVEFYSKLRDKIGSEGVQEIATALKDAGYRVRIEHDEGAAELIESTGFQKSLLREQGSKRAYSESWKAITGGATDISNFTFQTKLYHSTFEIEFDFKHELLPSLINVIIGPNGIGKSQTLKQLILSVLNSASDDEDPAVVNFNFSQIIAMSYSPFDSYPLEARDSSGGVVRNTYRYFGLRRKIKDKDSPKGFKISTDYDWPRRSLPSSIIEMVDDDRRNRKFSTWVEKTKLAQGLLREAIEFDAFGLLLSDVSLSTARARVDCEVMQDDEKIYVVIRSDQHISQRTIAFLKDSKPSFVFIKDNKPISWLTLSSGQRLFSYIVIPCIGAIKPNSLLILDEPEVYLHPNLEIELYKMLKKILETYSSIAIIATHSLIAVRESASSCVHVLSATNDGGIDVNHPPFETFGGDIQRISSYVFGDRSVSKPYEDWVREKLSTVTSGGFISAVRGKVSEEMLLKIYAITQENDVS